MKVLALTLVGMFLLTSASAQAQASRGADVVGLVLFYLSLTAVGVTGMILRGERAQAHIRAIREEGRAVFWRGFALTVVALLLTLLFGALSDSVRKAGDERTAGLIGLIALLVALAYLLLVLLGFGSMAVVLGDSAARLFGWRDMSAGWCIVLGSALFLLVVWIPLFGWALGIYWLSLCVGGLWSRVEAGGAG